MSVKHLLSFKDWSQGSVEQLLENSYKLKTGELLSRGLLESKTMGMIFEKSFPSFANDANDRK